MGGLKKLKENLYAVKGAMKLGTDALFVNEIFVQPYVYAGYQSIGGAVAGDYDSVFFTADRAYQVVQVRERHQTAGSSTTASVNVLKVPSGTAKASGTAVIANVIDLSTTADTNQTPALHATVANLQLAAGDSLGLVAAGTLTAVDGVAVQVILKPI